MGHLKMALGIVVLYTVAGCVFYVFKDVFLALIHIAEDVAGWFLLAVILLCVCLAFWNRQWEKRHPKRKIPMYAPDTEYAAIEPTPVTGIGPTEPAITTPEKQP